MALTRENYQTRLIDKKIERYLNVFGALCIEGPKWCGKRFGPQEYLPMGSIL